MRNLAIGQSGDVTATAQYKNAAGRWVTAPRPQKATRWKARVYVRGEDGLRQEIVRPTTRLPDDHIMEFIS